MLEKKIKLLQTLCVSKQLFLLPSFKDYDLNKLLDEDEEISILRFISNMQIFIDYAEQIFFSLKLEIHFSCFCYLI